MKRWSECLKDERAYAVVEATILFPIIFMIFFGMILMAKAGYDPNYAITFWKKFGGNSGGFLEAFTSTHPLGEDRIRAMRENLPEALKIYNASKVRYGAGNKLR